VFKLDELTTVSKTRFLVAGSVKSYSIEASRDGVDWFTVVDNTAQTEDWNGWREDYFSPVEALYFRVKGVKAPVSQSLTLYEFEVYSPVTEPVPYSVERFDQAGVQMTTDNALLLVWKSDSLLQTLFSNPWTQSTRTGRWSGKTLVEWAQEEGYKHYANLVSYAPAGTTEVLPGLKQAFDDSRALQDQFRKDGTTTTDLLQYARKRGWRTDERIREWAAKGGLLGAQPGTEARDADEKD